MNETIDKEEIELLALDIEGIDAEVILNLNFNEINVKYLSFEHIHLGDHRQHVLRLLHDNRFKYIGPGCDHNNYDKLFVKLT